MGRCVHGSVHAFHCFLCCFVQAAWAVGPGASAIDQVYACSGSLNGEAVLVFVRALCAVSQEELNPAQASDIPR